MDQLLDSVRAQFDSEGAEAEGQPWQPLSDDYAPWKAEHYPGAPILVRDGAMRAAMLSQSAVHVSPEMAIYEPISDIAGYHQVGPRDWMGPAWGRRIGGGIGRPYILYHHHLPERKMVDLTDEWKHEHVDRTFAAWIARKLAEDRAAVTPLAA